MPTLPTLEDLRAAHLRIATHVHRTPVLTSRQLDDVAGASLFFKCENFQRVGAFKMRGAANAVFALDEAVAARGVATHSSGNHGMALALAARLRGVPAHVVVPTNAPVTKRAAIEGYGGRIIDCAPTLDAREETLEQVLRDTGAHPVHPYENPFVIAGQGTAAIELLEEVAALDVVLTPIGGGGLTGGTALAVHHLLPQAVVVACEPAGADDAAQSFRTRTRIPQRDPRTIADGLRSSIGVAAYELLVRHVSDVVTVSEEAIVRAMRLVLERMKILIEPSAAVPVAAALEGLAPVRGKRVGIILSGGNVDLDRLPFSSRGD